MSLQRPRLVRRDEDPRSSRRLQTVTESRRSRQRSFRRQRSVRRVAIVAIRWSSNMNLPRHELDMPCRYPRNHRPHFDWRIHPGLRVQGVRPHLNGSD